LNLGVVAQLGRETADGYALRSLTPCPPIAVNLTSSAIADPAWPPPPGLSPPRPSSPTSHPPSGRGGRLQKQILLSCLFSLPSLPAGGCEVGERGWGSEGTEAAKRTRPGVTLHVRGTRRRG